MDLRASEIKNLSTEDLAKRINEAREELMNLRFRLSTGELTDHSQIGLTRRSIARLMTALSQRAAAQQEGE